MCTQSLIIFCVYIYEANAQYCCTSKTWHNYGTCKCLGIMAYSLSQLILEVTLGGLRVLEVEL